ncbi:MAG: hypothetical protein ACYC2O_10690 [Microthrixaceae bacterium]
MAEISVVVRSTLLDVHLELDCGSATPWGSPEVVGERRHTAGTAQA